MMKPAMSTVACPEWTLDRVAEAAAEYGFSAAELRTLGPASRQLAPDPALTASGRVRAVMRDHGVRIVSLATSVRFDEPVRPPVLGHVFGDTERSIREARWAVDLAVAVECPLVRVFGFQVPRRERFASCQRRIVERLQRAADHAHRTGARIALENGGSFERAEQIASILDKVDNVLVGACYSVAPAWAAGERPEDGVRALGDRLLLARIKDFARGKPQPLGQGDVPCRKFIEALTSARYNGAIVYEWDRMWIDDLAPAEEVLPEAARTLFAWIADAHEAAAAPTARDETAVGGMQPT